MTLSIYYLAAIVTLFTTSCAKSWKPLLQAEMISMTKEDFKKGHYKKAGEVSQEFCFESGSAKKMLTYKKGESDVGLVDEVVMIVQKEKKADGVANAVIDYDGGHCVRIEGVAITSRK